MYKATRAFKRFGIPIGLGPADRPQKPTRHHIHADTGWGPDIQILLFGRIPVLFYIFLSAASPLSFFLAPPHSLSFSSRALLLVTLGSGQGAIVTGLEGSSILKVAIPKGYVNSFFLVHFSIFSFRLFVPPLPSPSISLGTFVRPALYRWQYYYYYSYYYCFRRKDYTFWIFPLFYKAMTVFHATCTES